MLGVPFRCVFRSLPMRNCIFWFNHLLCHHRANLHYIAWTIWILKYVKLDSETLGAVILGVIKKIPKNFTFLAISAENRLEHKWWWVWGTITISGVNYYRGYGCDKNRLKCRIKCFADESWYIPQNIHNNLIEIFFFVLQID